MMTTSNSTLKKYASLRGAFYTFVERRKSGRGNLLSKKRLIPFLLSKGVSRLRCCRLFLFNRVLCIHLFHKKSRRLESIHPPLLPINGIRGIS